MTANYEQCASETGLVNALVYCLSSSTLAGQLYERICSFNNAVKSLTFSCLVFFYRLWDSNLPSSIEKKIACRELHYKSDAYIFEVTYLLFSLI